MTLLKIARLVHPVLLARAAPVVDVRDPAIQTLITDMVETLADVRGRGLAAPQVYRGLRLLIALRLDLETEREKVLALPPLVLANPQLEPRGDEMVSGFEGCLSIPGLRGWVPRHRRIRYRGVDHRGAPVAGEAEGDFARVLQHEIDHLDGILYLDRLKSAADLAFDSDVHHLEARTSNAG